DPDFLVEVDEDDDEAKRLETIGDSLDVDRLKAGFGKATSKGEVTTLATEVREKRFSALDQAELLTAYRDAVKRLSGTKPSIAEAKKALRPAAPKDSWLYLLKTDEDGRILSNLANSIVLLSHDPVWKGVLAFDTLGQRVVARRPIPEYGEGSLDDPYDHPVSWSDHLTTATRVYLQNSGITTSKDDAIAAIYSVARESQFNALVEHLSGLEWDGVGRLDTWLSVYCGAVDNEYTRGAGRMWLLAAVARAYTPGCKVDHMLVLEGPQGARKSTVGAIIGGRWFTDSLPPMGQDDVRLSMALRGKWIIEHSELSGIRKARIEEVKAFLTRQSEFFVPKFGREEVEEPRSCIFYGSSNPDGAGYLSDTTGNRRFWPVTVAARIDTEALTRDRDQLLAEAVFRQQVKREPWWPDAEWERNLARPEQELREAEADPWTETVAKWLDGESGGLIDEAGREINKPRIERVTSAEVIEKALGVQARDINRGMQMRISIIMKGLGWLQKKSGGGVRRWVRPDYDAVEFDEDDAAGL
ncbi:virulence-associated E family protein, partial [Roseomonas marmotae]